MDRIFVRKQIAHKLCTQTNKNKIKMQITDQNIQRGKKIPDQHYKKKKKTKTA